MKLNKQLLAHMRKATRTLLNKGPVDTAAIVQEAMKHANAFQRPAASPGAPMRDLNPPPANGAARQAAPAGTMPDMLANLQRSMEAVREQFGGLGGTEARASWPGSFLSGSHANAAGARDYKLYVPSTLGEGPAALVVMLHGCTQDPDDFAHGTGMNALAEELRCLVVYPAQSQAANPSRCWNWFNEADQQHGRGEPSIIAGITRDVMARYPVDARQVFVAGLSAGGAMATIMGTLYPDLYAAVGVHSGLPFAAANDLPSALAAMKGEFRRSQAPGRPLPVIVFHGDRDTTVHPANGDALVAHARAARRTAEPGQVPDGHAYTRTTHHHADGTLHAEHWLIHGAGHAWSGGNARGSYTDGKGPDASREMMRFFRTRR